MSTVKQSYDYVIVGAGVTAASAVRGIRSQDASGTIGVLGSEPDKVAINLAMSFVDFPWRYSHVPQPETTLRLYQNIAHGAPPAVVVSGPMEQQDRSGLLAAKPGLPPWRAG